MKVVIQLMFIYLCSGSLCFLISAETKNGSHEDKVKYGWGQNPGSSSSGGCIDPSAIELASNIDRNFFNRIRLWYVTGSSISTYKAIAKVLLGREPRSQKELELMCHTRTFGKIFTEPSGAIHGGYGAQYSIITNPLERFGMLTVTTNLDLKTFDGKLGVNPFLASEEPVSAALVKTDNHSYSIFYLCSGNSSSDVLLLTTRPYVSPTVAQIYKYMVRKMKINPIDVQLLPCSSPNFGNQSQPQMGEARIILPKSNNNGTSLEKVRQKLEVGIVNSFGGFTYWEGLGGWKSEDTGILYHDPVWIYDIALSDTQVNRNKLSEIALWLHGVAEQESIYLRFPNGEVNFI